MPTQPQDDDAWEAATWEGCRRAQLRRSLELSVRERLEILESMGDLSERLAAGRRAVRRRTEGSPTWERLADVLTYTA